MKHSDAGYTLLEMLVALVVFGLVMAGIAQSFRFGLTAWSAAPRTITAPEDMAAADAALTRMINQALPGSLTGLANCMAFTTTLPPAAGLPGRLADVAIMKASDGTLILRYGPHPAGIILTPPPPPRIEPLVPGVARLTISYLVPQPGGAPAWSGSCSGTELPLLIRIHIAFANGRGWPDLIAAPVDLDSAQGKAPPS
jgi:general secretion pathway protein J